VVQNIPSLESGEEEKKNTQKNKRVNLTSIRSLMSIDKSVSSSLVAADAAAAGAGDGR